MVSWILYWVWCPCLEGDRHVDMLSGAGDALIDVYDVGRFGINRRVDLGVGALWRTTCVLVGGGLSRFCSSVCHLLVVDRSVRWGGIFQFE